MGSAADPYDLLLAYDPDFVGPTAQRQPVEVELNETPEPDGYYEDFSARLNRTGGATVLGFGDDSDSSDSDSDSDAPAGLARFVVSGDEPHVVSLSDFLLDVDGGDGEFEPCCGFEWCFDTEVCSPCVAASPRAESPRAESPRAESPRAESPRAESPRAESPRLGGAKGRKPHPPRADSRSPKADSHASGILQFAAPARGILKFATPASEPSEVCILTFVVPSHPTRI